MNALENPPVTLLLVMEQSRFEDADLMCDLGSEFGFVDFMLEGQEVGWLRELCDYLGSLLASPDVTEEQFADLIVRCRGDIFEASARDSLLKLYNRARDHIAASYR